MDEIEDEILELLRQGGPQPGEGLSVAELAQRSGRSQNFVTAQLRRLNQEGRLVVRFRRSWRIDGHPYHVPVYSLRRIE